MKKYTRYAIRDVTNGDVVVATGNCLTRLGVADPGSPNYNPVLFANCKVAKEWRDNRLGPGYGKERFRIVPVTITIG